MYKRTILFLFFLLPILPAKAGGLKEIVKKPSIIFKKVEAKGKVLGENIGRVGEKVLQGDVKGLTKSYFNFLRQTYDPALDYYSDVMRKLNPLAQMHMDVDPLEIQGLPENISGNITTTSSFKYEKPDGNSFDFLNELFEGLYSDTRDLNDIKNRLEQIRNNLVSGVFPRTDDKYYFCIQVFPKADSPDDISMEISFKNPGLDVSVGSFESILDVEKNDFKWARIASLPLDIYPLQGKLDRLGDFSLNGALPVQNGEFNQIVATFSFKTKDGKSVHECINAVKIVVFRDNLDYQEEVFSYNCESFEKASFDVQQVCIPIDAKFPDENETLFKIVNEPIKIIDSAILEIGDYLKKKPSATIVGTKGNNYFNVVLDDLMERVLIKNRSEKGLISLESEVKKARLTTKCIGFDFRQRYRIRIKNNTYEKSLFPKCSLMYDNTKKYSIEAPLLMPAKSEIVFSIYPPVVTKPKETRTMNIVFSGDTKDKPLNFLLEVFAGIDSQFVPIRSRILRIAPNASQTISLGVEITNSDSY